LVMKEWSYTSTPLMGRTACTYYGAIYLFYVLLMNAMNLVTSNTESSENYIPIRKTILTTSLILPPPHQLTHSEPPPPTAPSPHWSHLGPGINTGPLSSHLHTKYPAFEDGTDRWSRNAGIQKSDVGDTPKRLLKTRRKFEIKNPQKFSVQYIVHYCLILGRHMYRRDALWSKK
jgi:hypothetical protein